MKTSIGRRNTMAAGIALAAMLTACGKKPGDPDDTNPNRNPSVTATASANDVLMGATSVTFTATGNDPDGDALTYSWSFGDGTSATGASVTHVFAAPGTFNVSVTANDGKQGTATGNATVTARSLAGAWVSQARAWDFEIQHSGSRITGRLLGFKNVRFDPAPTLAGMVTSPRSVQFDVPGGLSFVGTANAGATQMTGTLSEGSRNYGEVLDKQ